MDTVIGHAGGCGLHPFASTSEAEFERIFRFNFFAQTYLARAVLSQWVQRKIAGHLIFTSSYVARMPHTQISAYASAKAALENFARSLALEYALTGIRVNVVSPGNVAAGSSLKVFDEDPAYREFVLRVSLGRRNSPESVADAFVFLCSPLANEINGQVMSPDLRRRYRKSPMKIGLGLYRHMLTRDYYDFARQAGCTHVVVHLVDYFNQGPTNPRNNQPTGSKYEPWGVAGDPEKLWTVQELNRCVTKLKMRD